MSASQQPPAYSELAEQNPNTTVSNVSNNELLTQALKKINELETRLNKQEHKLHEKSKKEKLNDKIQELGIKLKKERKLYGDTAYREYQNYNSYGFGFGISHERVKQYKNEIDILERSINELKVEYYKCID
ncbi:MAG: hypothetical protein Terrestrivirus1_126 [Terrestrivirus sp.]|uniref:Uncharacterized protein n=1 Tax=Terrestrivirus sp. TaxID=2487775 RepID=A0A3G4ZK87_9VIRU|nr:MAG: hypothetical protein Terrestrivirus1_126 [Terrestrivirus sp.]